MHPDGYPAAILTKRETISVVNPLKLLIQRIGYVHPETAPFEEENWRLLVPFLLRVATFVRRLWYHHWYRGWGARATLTMLFRGGIVSLVIVQLGFYIRKSIKRVEEPELTLTAMTPRECTRCSWK